MTLDEETVAKLAAVLHPDERPRDGFEELYVALDAAIDKAAELVALAQSLLPDDASVGAFVALQELCRVKAQINPGTSEKEPF